jgi:hypothetical protein
LIAEPVGSCTDLKATVSYPLRQLYGDDYLVAPLSVLVDPLRCARILGVVQDGKTFSEKVVYVYRKQLEEAEVLVVNKVDLLAADTRTRLVEALRREFPQAEVMEVSASTGQGLEAWFDRITGGELGHRRSMDVDYDTYAEGEALLGWLNARGPVRAAAGPGMPAEFDGNAFLTTLATRLRDALAADGVEIAHLKMTLSPAQPGQADAGRLNADLAAVSLTRTDGSPQQTHVLQSPLSAGDLVLNLRAEADPELLRAKVLDVVRQTAINTGPATAELQVLAAFRPGRPTPTHRLATAAG